MTENNLHCPECNKKLVFFPPAFKRYNNIIKKVKRRQCTNPQCPAFKTILERGQVSFIQNGGDKL